MVAKKHVSKQSKLFLYLKEALVASFILIGLWCNLVNIEDFESSAFGSSPNGPVLEKYHENSLHK